MPLFPGIFGVSATKALLVADLLTYSASRMRRESDCDPPPEPGFARREAHRGEVNV
jgi:hypothetical protein